MIEQLLRVHGRAVLFFSAGKDSLATLLLLKDYWDYLDVVWANPGATYPRVQDYMSGISRRVSSFVELHGEQPDWVAKHGWPADVVPVRSTIHGQNHAGQGDIRMQPYFACCQHNMWGPMGRYLEESGHTLTINGQRRQEAMRNRSRDEMIQEVSGISYFQPINEWSTADVFDFLRDQNEPLPPFYDDGAESSADCWNCTAYLDHNQARLKHMRQSDPQRWSVMEPLLRQMHSEINHGAQALRQLLA